MSLREIFRRPAVLLIAVVAVFFVAVLLPVWIAAGHYCFSQYDFGIYSQAVAKLSWSNLNPWLTGRQIRVFNDHFDPILIFATIFRPVMRPHAAALLTEGLMVLACLAPLVWLHKLGKLGTQGLALVAVMLLFNSSVISALRYPVHPTTWATFPWVALIAGLIARRRIVVLVSLCLLFACKEEFPFVGLMLAGGLALRGERRFAAQVFALTAGWLIFVFAIRPWLMGPSANYSANLLIGMDASLASFFWARLTAEGMWSRIGSMLIVYLPVAIWAYRNERKPQLYLLALLLPMLGIRFFGMAWRFHYGAPLMVAAVAMLIPVVADRKLPRWVIVTTLALLVTTNMQNVHYARRVLKGNNYPKHCPPDAARLESIGDGIEMLSQRRDGRALIEGGMMAHLADRPEVYVINGPQRGKGLSYRYVLTEKPPRGNPFPGTNARVTELIDVWRERSSTVYIDDEHVFFAEGSFTADQ